MDAIALIGLAFHAYHGARAEERALGQRFVVDVRMELDVRDAARADDLELTVNYALVWDAVREVVEGPAMALLETLAERIAETVLTRFERVQAVWVRVAKPAAPIRGAILDTVAVEITRQRSAGAGRTKRR